MKIFFIRKIHQFIGGFYFCLEYSLDMENILNTESQSSHESSIPNTAPDTSGQRYDGGERESHRDHTPSSAPSTPEQK